MRLKRPRKEEEETNEGDDEGVDPVIVFLLGPSEHIHHCIQLPSTSVQVGRDPEESFINTTTWIHETITNLTGFQDSYSCLPAMTFTPGQQGATAHKYIRLCNFLMHSFQVPLYQDTICTLLYEAIFIILKPST